MYKARSTIHLNTIITLKITYRMYAKPLTLPSSSCQFISYFYWSCDCSRFSSTLPCHLHIILSSEGITWGRYRTHSIEKIPSGIPTRKMFASRTSAFNIQQSSTLRSRAMGLTKNQKVSLLILQSFVTH